MQARRLVLASFLGRAWPPPALASVSRSFVLGVLLPAAGDAHFYRGEGWEELQRGVAAWVGACARAQPAQERWQLLLDLLTCGSAASQRPLAQTVAAALAEAAVAAGADAGEQAAEQRLLFLRALREATQRLSFGWGSGGATGSFAVGVCGNLLQAAAAAAPLGPACAAGGTLGQATLQAAGAWLQQLPLSLLQPGGPLQHAAAAWVCGAAQRQQVLLLLGESVAGFVQGSGSEPAEGAADDAAAQWAAWQQQAGALARLALLLSDGGGGEQEEGVAAPHAAQLSPADLAAAFASWTDTLGALYRRQALGGAACIHLVLHCQIGHTVCVTVAATVSP